LALVHERYGDAFGWNRKRRGRRALRLPPSASALCRARQNLVPAELEAMIREAQEMPLAVAARERWRWKCELPKVLPVPSPKVLPVTHPGGLIGSLPWAWITTRGGRGCSTSCPVLRSTISAKRG
jgi:hypothetical protein